MEVKDIMSSAVVTIKENDDVKKAVSIICLKKISGLPVVNEDNQLTGMLSEKDILKAIYPTYKEYIENPQDFKGFEDMQKRYLQTSQLKVKDIFTKNLISVEPSTSLLKALSTMIIKHIRRLPVVDQDGNLIGIVSQGDIHQALFIDEFLHH